MFKSARNRVQKIGRNRGLFLMRISFLITVGLTFWGCYDSTDGVFAIIMDAVISVVVAAFLFEWVALGLLLLIIPLVVLVRTFQGGGG